MCEAVVWLLLCTVNEHAESGHELAHPEDPCLDSFADEHSMQYIYYNKL